VTAQAKACGDIFLSVETPMTPEELVARVKKRAKQNFKTGLNCAESVLEAVLPEQRCPARQGVQRHGARP
jgi:4'-phosphopantetheinyl transferase EntD